jgi:hypothetical protein
LLGKQVCALAIGERQTMTQTCANRIEGTDEQHAHKQRRHGNFDQACRAAT